MGGVFVALVLQYFPILREENGGAVFDGFFLAVYRAFRIFLVDGEWENTAKTLEAVQSVGLRTVFERVCITELIVMPFLSAGFVLSFFGGLTARLRYAFSWFCPTFVFSKLNAQSLAFAKSVRKKHPHGATIVFTDVFYEHGDDGYELLCEAKDLRAVCLKRDITHLRYGKGWWKKFTCLIMGDDESENLAQTIELTERLKIRPRTAIYVYATSAGSGYIMDSLDKGDLLIPPSLKRRLLKDLTDNTKENGDASKNGFERLFSFLENGVQDKRLYSPADGLTVSRVDSVYNTVLDTFCDSDIFEVCNRQRKDKVISLLIVGMGAYGKQILKTAVWYCQMGGYTLEINVIDSGKDKYGNRRDIEDVLRHECPEIISRNKKAERGEAQYNIRFFKNVECFNHSLDKVFEDKRNAQRLKRTLMAFVALGDDDKNIEAAILLRKLFDRLQGCNNDTYENLREAAPTVSEAADKPRIYTVVYDDRKAQNLNINRNADALKQPQDSYLVDYKETPYHIHCIGNLSSQFSYDALLRAQEIERQAFVYHTNWASIDIALHKGLQRKENAALCQEILAQEGKQSLEEIKWEDDDLLKLSLEGKQDYLQRKIEAYKRFEYYRFSSVAKAVHKKLINSELFKQQTACKVGGKNPLCRCKGCEWKRETEHKRWNAYVRSQGYRCGESRADRAQVHDCLIPNEKLSWRTRFKD